MATDWAPAVLNAYEALTPHLPDEDTRASVAKRVVEQMVEWRREFGFDYMERLASTRTSYHRHLVEILGVDSPASRPALSAAVVAAASQMQWRP